MINQANTLINGVEASSLSSADKRVNGIWICLAVFYHQLVMEFAPTYSLIWISLRHLQLVSYRKWDVYSKMFML
jgi:hypothetical protein